MRVDGVDLFSVLLRTSVQAAIPSTQHRRGTEQFQMIQLQMKRCQHGITANLRARARETHPGLQKLLLILGSKAAVEFRDRVLESATE